MIMTNKELNQFLIASFPELKHAYNEEVSWQEGDDTGSHVVFGDVFTPYLEKLIETKNEEKFKIYGSVSSGMGYHVGMGRRIQLRIQ